MHFCAPTYLAPRRFLSPSAATTPVNYIRGGLSGCTHAPFFSSSTASKRCTFLILEYLDADQLVVARPYYFVFMFFIDKNILILRRYPLDLACKIKFVQ